MFSDSIKQIVAGEGATAELIYLCATTRLFDKPMSLAVKGESAVGKSHLLDSVFSYIPPQEIESFTTMTERSLIYLSDLSLRHKILRMAEAVGGKQNEMQDYLIREIISTGRITHLIAVPGPPGELASTQRKVTEGPIMFATTTTKARLHPEIETRILSLEADDTEAQTARVLEKVAEIEGGLIKSTVDLAPWHAFQHWLGAGERRVVVPYIRTLARHGRLYRKKMRLRRDFGQLIRAIQAQALLHRNHRKRDDAGRIVATINDYAVVFDLMGHRLAQGAGTKMKNNDMEVLEAVRLAQPVNESDGGVKVQTLVEQLDLDQTTVNRRLSKLESAGYVENLNPGKGRTGRFRVIGEPEDIGVLPSPEDLLEACKRKSSPQASPTPPIA